MYSPAVIFLIVISSPYLLIMTVAIHVRHAPFHWDVMNNELFGQASSHPLKNSSATGARTSGTISWVWPERGPSPDRSNAIGVPSVERTLPMHPSPPLSDINARPVAPAC